MARNENINGGGAQSARHQRPAGIVRGGMAYKYSSAAQMAQAASAAALRRLTKRCLKQHGVAWRIMWRRRQRQRNNLAFGAA